MKLDEPDRIRLRHMIEAAEVALGFIAGRSLEEFRSDKMIQFAVAVPWKSSARPHRR